MLYDVNNTKSYAIVRMIARATGLAGRNESEIIELDELSGFAEDMRKAYSTLAYNSSASTLKDAFVR